ncbi:hypothetical protein [Ruminococcus flavefaciens]|uniref:hypothetical protein n=1 Tax=Ruminococcus flavefaciens TaxID=1265 RepID=UPI001568A818|nr:hypothetical protein [Ruminococcus flavefaciens]
MSSIYTCPHCGKKSFTPLSKAKAGQLNSSGKPCKECGRLCVNGKAATAFNAVFSLIMFALMIIVYLKAPVWYDAYSKGGGSAFLNWVAEREMLAVVILLLAKIFVPKLVNAFFFPLEPSIRIETKL